MRCAPRSFPFLLSGLFLAGLLSSACSDDGGGQSGGDAGNPSSEGGDPNGDDSNGTGDGGSDGNDGGTGASSNGGSSDGADGGTGGTDGGDRDFEVGDAGPAGGLIFYDRGESADGWRYLEAAPADWFAGGDPEKFSFNCDGKTHGTDSAVGSGQANTQKFLDTGCSSGVLLQVDKLAIEVDGVTYDDWFVPSKDELALMYDNLASEGKGLFRQSFYLSSTEVDKDLVAAVHMGNGAQDKVFKGIAAPFRPVRAF